MKPMAAPTRTTREDWIDAGLRALASHGPAGVRVETVAEDLGVTKGGFYGQFGDRARFLDELLATWERRSTDEVLAQVASADDARQRMRRAGALTFSDELLPVDLAVRSWARTNDGVAARLRRVDDRRMDYLRQQLSTYLDDPDQVEGRATLAFTLAIGQHFIAADHEGRTRDQAVALATSILLE